LTKVIFFQEAQRVQTNPSLDFFSTPAGTPLERAVARNKSRLVQLFLEFMPPVFPSNGPILRRTLLLAFRYHNFKIQKALLNYMKSKPALIDYSISPISYTSWEYKGRKHHFLDAIVLGPISGVQGVPDLPKNLWNVCCHGKRSEEAVIQSINISLEMMGDNDMDIEASVDEAIRLSIDERITEMTRQLLIKKADVTDGEKSRVRSLWGLTWMHDPPRACTDLLQNPGVGTFLREDIQNSYRLLESYHGLPDDGLYSM
jgi:hypothetical protein